MPPEALTFTEAGRFSRSRATSAGGAAGGEAGGGLDVSHLFLGGQLAELDLLHVAEQAGLDDDLQRAAQAGGLDAGDLVGDVVPLAVLHHAVVDDHVDLAGPVFHGVLGLKDLGGSGVVAVGEADDGADL